MLSELLLRPIYDQVPLRVIDLIAILLFLVLTAYWSRRRSSLEEKERPLPHPTTEPKPIEPKPVESKPAPPEPTAAAAPRPQATWESALQKSRNSFFGRLQNAFASLTTTAPWNEQHPLWEALEEALITSDIGPKMTQKLLDSLKQDFREQPSLEHLKERLRQHMQEVLELVPVRANAPDSGPRVTILMGVNGSGKTTTTGKLAYQAKQAGKKVILGAGDTFRAAAVEQLKVWADRIGVECIMPASGANPAAVAFDTVAAGISREAEEIIIDTAGRLHTKESLMDELGKLGRVIQKKLPGAPHRVLLVLDATLGQNALIQAKEFTAALPATGVVLTKLDGSSKGGAAFSVVADLGLPVELVGLGESPEDLRRFSAKDFVANLVPDN